MGNVFLKVLEIAPKIASFTGTEYSGNETVRVHLNEGKLGSAYFAELVTAHSPPDIIL